MAGANANRLLKREDVKEYISQQLKEQKNKQTADIEEIMQFLTSVLRGEVPEEVAHYDSNVFKFKFDNLIVFCEVIYNSHRFLFVFIVC